jgi:phosphatidate cytidylyltransferase
MKDRIATGVALVVFLLIVGLVNNVYLTGFVIAVIAAFGINEAWRLFGIKDDNAWYFLLFTAFLSIFVNPVFIAVISVLVIGGYIAYYQKDIRILAPALYPFVPLMLLYDLYLKTSMGMIGWLIVIVALTDTFAYVIGKNFAGRFVSSGFCATSPNKSWEGTIGGILVASIVGSIIGLAFFNFLDSLIISFVVSIAGVFGDLFESFLKRRAGVKDSGNILPGHGGVLDRIDSYLFAAPMLWGLIQAMGHA